MLVSHICAQRMPGRLLIPFRIPLYDRVVNLFCLMVLELNVQGAMSLSVAREDHHTAGDLVESMNNPYLSVFIFKHSYQIRRVLFPAIRQDGEARRFIQDQQMFVFVKDIHVIKIITLRRFRSFRFTLRTSLLKVSTYP